MAPTLVIMAAGLGSRFGGTKQLAEVASDGSAIIDFTIDDAVAAGLRRVVVVVRRDIEAAVREHLDPRHPDVDLVYRCQDDLGPNRAKPWGTGHAVLAAADAVHGPFLVGNADDHYGPTTPARLAAKADDLAPGHGALAGFGLERTLPPDGPVSRAICEVDGGALVGLVETHGIVRRSGGEVTATDPPGRLDADAVTSMNYWLFPHDMLTRLEAGWQRFLAEHHDHTTAEYLLPDLVGQLIDAGELTIDVLPTAEPWVGITHPDDVDLARRAIAEHRA